MVAKWTYTVRGGLDRHWTESTAAPCAYAGSGGSRFSLRSTPIGSIMIIRSPYTGRLIEPNYVFPALRIRGTWTDGRVRNPPEDPNDCTAGEPAAPAGGCGPFDDLYSLQMFTDPYRTPGRATLRTGINQIEKPCGTYFTGLTNGARDPVRIGHPTLRQFLHARRPLTFTTDDQTHDVITGDGFRYEETMDRHVVMRFTRIR